MLSITGILLITMGSWCMFKPEIVGMFDGFSIKPSTNKYYHSYIKRFGLALLIVGVGMLEFGLLIIVFGDAWLNIIRDFVSSKF